MTSENNGMYMPVAPAFGYGGGNGGFGFGGQDGWWLILLFLLCGNGMWGGFGGMGGMWPMMMGGIGAGFGMDYLYPWLNNSEHISDGFRDQQIQTSIAGLQNSVTSGFGDVQLGIAGVNQNICQTGNGIVNAITGAQNAVSQQLYTNEIANLNRSFAEQTANVQGFNNVQAQLAQCCCDNRAATADLKYTVATEACADRTAAATNTRDIIDAQTRGTQAILDKLCALELDGVKGQLAQAQRENVGLQNQLNMAALRESQTAQNAFISQGFANEVDALYNRLNSCPVPTTPVYGRTPIFTCGNNGCGCSGYNGFAN
jgi:hypothetical protein